MGFTIQVACTALTCCLCMMMGVMFAFPSSTLRLFESNTTTLHRPMTETELALLGSLSSVGALIANPVAGIYLDRLGRKYCALIPGVLCSLSWALIIISNRVEVLLTAVFISGLTGAVFLVVPVYISEFCQESIRGAMTSGSMMFYGLGILLSYILGGYLDYHVMTYVYLTMSVVGTLCVSILKESPVFLMTKGREDEAAKSIAFYRGVKADSKEVFEEINTIRRALRPNMDTPEVPIEEEKLKPVEKEPAVKLSLWQFIKRSRATRRALFVTLVLVSASVCQGMVVVQVYAQPLFEEAVPTMSATLCSIIMAVISVSVCFIAAYLTELAGRRPLLIYSSFAAGVSCILLGTQIHLRWGPNWLTAVAVYLFAVMFTLGAGTVPYVIIPEVFLPEVKSFVSMLVIEWAWLCNSVILFIFNPLLHAIGLGPVFYIFATVCFLTAAFCIFFLPETKGLPMDEIQALFDKKKRGRSYA